MFKDHSHRWIVNNEKTMSVKEAGHFKLNGVLINLPKNCHFVMRHERRPKGELVLKSELIWHPEADTQSEISDEFIISDTD